MAVAEGFFKGGEDQAEEGSVAKATRSATVALPRAVLA